MNDDELGRVLHDELHRRIDPPEGALESVHEHLRALQSTQPVRTSGARSTRVFRDLFGIAAAAAICVLVAAGLFLRPSSQPKTGMAEPPKNGIEAFCRVDSKVAWAEAGSDLYITGDGGETWSKGTVPGGMSPAQLFSRLTTSTAAPADTPTPVTEPYATDTPAPILRMPGHYYPDFVDADHGWLLSWTASNATAMGADYSMTAWRTSDGGQHWASTALAGTYRGTGLMQFVDASHGWITVLRSDYQAGSAGQGSGSGSASATPAPTFSIPSDATIVLATADGGVTWTKASTLAAMALPRFVSPTEAWGYAETDLTASEYSVIHSTDGGRTWQTSGLPLPGNGNVIGWPDPPTEANGSVTARLAYMMPAGPDFLTFVSRDDGMTWSLESRNSDHNSTDASINSLASLLDLPAGQPFVMTTGTDPAAPTGFKATFDGGETWTTYSTSGLPSPAILAEWTSPDDAWVMTESSSGGFLQLGSQLYATHDRGKTWTALLGAPAWPASPEPSATPVIAPTAPAVEATSMITDMGRLDPKAGWVLIQDASGASLLRFSRDGGATWSDARKAPPGNQTQFIDVSHGWTTSLESTAKSTSITIHRTTDGGATWQDSSVILNTGSDNAEEFFSMAFHFRDALHGELWWTFGPMTATGPNPSSSIGWTCQQLSTDDGGVSWSAPANSPCFGQVAFENDSLGYASDWSMSPVLYVTVDGGQTWTRGTLPEGSTVGSTAPIHLVERLHGPAGDSLVAFGDWGPSNSAPAVVSSTDLGRTWVSVGVAKGLPSIVLSTVELSENRWLAIVETGEGSSSGRVLEVSSDEGLTWQPAAGLEQQPAGLDFVSATDGWAIVSGVSCQASSATPQPCQQVATALYGTTDGGAAWKELLTP